MLEPFDVRLTEPMRTIVLAKTGMGKSYLIRDVLYTNRFFFTSVYVFAGSDDVRSSYEDIVPDLNLINGWDEDRFKKIWDQCFDSKKLAEKLGIPMPQTIILLDDLAFDKSIWKSKIIGAAYMNGRHRGLSMLVATQYIMMLPTTVRSQAKYVFALRETSTPNIRKMHNEWFGIVPTLGEFKSLLIKATANFGTLVVNTMSRSAEMAGALYVYCAKKTPPVFSTDPFTGKRKREWRLCDDRIWHLARAARRARKLKKRRIERKRREVIARGGLVM